MTHFAIQDFFDLLTIMHTYLPWSRWNMKIIIWSLRMTKIIYLCITGRKNDIVMHQKYIEMFVTIIYLGHGHTIITYAAINFGSALRIDLEFESIFNLDENNLNEKKTFFSKGQFSSILFEISPFIGTGCKNSLRIFSSFFHTALNWFFSPLAEFLNFFHTDMISRDFSSKFKFFDWLFWFWDFSAETKILR